MKLFFSVLLCAFIFPCLANSNIKNNTATKVTEPPVIHILAENLFPLHYLKNGKVVGSSVDLIKKVMTKAKLNYEIKIQPWARIYQVAQRKKNVLLLSISRIKERESLFQWLGMTMQIKYSLYSISNNKIDANIPLKQLNNYRIAILRQSAIHQFLAAKGLNNFQLFSTYTQAIKMLLAHRVDLVSGVSQFFIKNCIRLQFNCQSIKTAYQFKDPSPAIYMAMSKNTDLTIINKIKTAHQQVMLNK